MQIYLKSNLGMPLGKQIAQGSHSLCAYILGSFDFTAGCWKGAVAALEQQVANFELVYTETSPDSSALIVIEDQGHTVFNKVPTVTSWLVATPAEMEKTGYAKTKHEKGGTTDIRMTLVSVKEARKGKSKEDIVKEGIYQAALLLVVQLTQWHFKQMSTSQQNLLKEWSTGTFAKIVLNCSEEEGTRLAKTANIASWQAGSLLNWLVYSPTYKELQNEKTGTLKML